MPVTELATIYLKPRTAESSLLPMLQKAKAVQEKASGFPAYYFQDTTNANKLYILGTWQSREEHMAFLPQKENQDVLELLMPVCDIEKPFTLTHIDVELTGDGGVGFIDGKGLGVVMYGVETRWKNELEDNIREQGKGLSFSGNHKEFWGWMIEKEDKGKETFVSIKGIDGEPVLGGNTEDVASQISSGHAKYGIHHWSWFRGKRLPDL